MANIVVGVTGGIAAYKSAPLIRLFAEAGHNVQVVATVNAFRFIGQATLEALSGNQVEILDPDMFTDVDQVKHIATAKSADLIVVAPATASFIAKVAAGIADDLLTTTVLAATCPVVLAPAMHTEMWLNDATQTNLKTLVSRKLQIVEPGTGRLTGEDSGVGRMAEPREIFEKAVSALGGILSGKRVVVTAGGTREPIDIARFVGNYSSGKQGLAFARSAQRMGADVILIAANLDEANAIGLDVSRVSTAQELDKAVKANVLNCDIFIMAAAVADYRPKDSTSTKIKRLEVGEELELKLVMNPDVLAGAVKEIKERGSRTITLGFAAESSADLEELALLKLKTKGCDYIFANDVSDGAVFGRDTTSALLVSSEKSLPFTGSKEQVAELVLTEIASNMGEL